MLESALYHTVDTENRPTRIARPTRDNQRTAGTMPVWNNQKSDNTLTKNRIASPQNPHAFTQILSTAQNPDPAPQTSESFDFGDLIDMVNPLHHLPLINTAYRHITGDTIKPISKLVGGAAFGGPVGLVSNLADIAIENETGKTMTQHAIAIVNPPREPSAPEQTLTLATQNGYNHDTDFTRTLLSFSDLGHQTPPPTPEKTTRQPRYND